MEIDAIVYQCLIWPCLVNARFVEHVLLYLIGQMLALAKHAVCGIGRVW